MSAITRRSFLTTAATGLAASALASAARAAEGQTSDQILDELMRENQENGLGSGFDNSSRNVRLPKKSLPTLSPSTAETTQPSIAQYETIVAKGGWPDMPASADGLHVGAKGATVPALRRRLSVAGDLELNSGDPQGSIPVLSRCGLVPHSVRCGHLVTGAEKYRPPLRVAFPVATIEARASVCCAAS